MQIFINGLSREVEEDTNLKDILESLSAEKQISFSGAVVLINEVLIPKAKWKDTQIEASAKIEVLSFVSGG